MPPAAFLHRENAPKLLAAGAYSASPDPLAGLRGPASKGRGGEVTGGEGLWTITMLETDSLGKTNERAI